MNPIQNLKKKSVLTITVNPAVDLTAIVHSLHVGNVNRIHSQQEDAGGKGVNVASFLATFAVPVSVAGFLGSENDQAFRRLFADKGIKDAFTSVPGRTRTNFKVIDESRGADGITDLNFPGFRVEAKDVLALEKTLGAIARDHEWCVISGSLPEGLASTFYKGLVQQLKDFGCKVALDTSGLALTEALESGPDLIKPNEEELSSYLGKKILDRKDLLDASRVLHQKGVKTVIISMGAEGAFFSRVNECVWAKASALSVKSTVGAGDAMVAGAVAASLDQLSLEDTARIATAFSMGTLIHLGPRMADPMTVSNFLSSIAVEKVDASDHGKAKP